MIDGVQYADQSTFQTCMLFVQETAQELVHVLIRLQHKPLQRYEHTNSFTGTPFL